MINILFNDKIITIYTYTDLIKKYNLEHFVNNTKKINNKYITFKITRNIHNIKVK
jgi:hypothetical protein